MMVKIEVGISIQFIIFLVSIMNLEIVLGFLVHSFIYSLLIYLTRLLIICLCVRDCNGL